MSMSFVLWFMGLGAVFYIRARTSPIIVFVLSVCIFGFLFSIYLSKWVLSKDEGRPEMYPVQFIFYFYLNFDLCTFKFYN